MLAKLTRNERIRQRAEFLAMQAQGIKARGRFLTIVSRRSEFSVSRLGIVAPRRLGNAVYRNRIKRRVREIFRQNKPEVCLDLVVLPLRNFLDASFGSLQADYRRTLRRQFQSRGSR